MRGIGAFGHLDNVNSDGMKTVDTLAVRSWSRMKKLGRMVGEGRAGCDSRHRRPW